MEVRGGPLVDDASSALASLSPRELLVLSRLTRPGTLDEVAEDLFVSRNTVKTQLRSAYRKIGVRSRAGAVAWARDAGLGEPE